MTCHIRRKEGPRSCWAIKHNADNLALFQFFLGSHRRCNLPHKSQSQQKSLSAGSGTAEQKSRLSQGPSPAPDGQNQQLNPPQSLPFHHSHERPLQTLTLTPFLGGGAKRPWLCECEAFEQAHNCQRIYDNVLN